jgi:hypothetical protein
MTAFETPILRIYNCTFSDTAANQALFLDLGHQSFNFVRLLVSITRNVFERNLQGLYFHQLGHYVSTTRIIIDENTFSNNNGGCCSGALKIYWQRFIEVKKNVFFENIGEYVASLETKTTTSFPDAMDKYLVFTDNLMVNNSLSPITSGYAKSTPNAVVVFRLVSATLRSNTLIVRFSKFAVSHNTFDNPNASKELAVSIGGFSSSYTIDMSRNWWGTANETEIAKKIFDFDDRNDLVRVIYFPFLLSPSPSDVVPLDRPRTHPSFLNWNSEIGGQLAIDFTLSADRGPYTVTRDMTILPNATLTVEAGTVVEFRQFVELLVEGSLITKGTPNNPVVFKRSVRITPPSPRKQSVVRLAHGGTDLTSVYGYVEVQLDGVWQPLCSYALESDYESIDRISHLICQQFEFHYGKPDAEWRWNSWFPALGDPTFHDLLCPETASSLSDCLFNTSDYANHTDCSKILYVECHCWDCRYNASAAEGKWAGIRFLPITSIPTASSSHRIPKSVLIHTKIQGAGQRYDKTVPSVQAIFRPPETNGLTIVDSASTAIEVLQLHESAAIRGLNITGASGDGLAVRRPGGNSLTVESVTVQNVAGAGIRISRRTTSFVSRWDYQSICTGQDTIFVDEIIGSYIGVPDKKSSFYEMCTVVLQGPPNTTLSVRILSLGQYSSGSVYILDGARPTSPPLFEHFYRRPQLEHYGNLIVSSTNKVFVGYGTFFQIGASTLALYVESITATGEQPSVTIRDSSVYDAQDGVYIQNVDNDVSIKNVSVVDALNYGVSFESHLGDVTVSDCRIVNARNVGVDNRLVDGSVTMTDNRIINSYQGIVTSVANCDMTISGNIISEAKQRAAYFYFLDSLHNIQSCSYRVSRNTFVRGNDGIHLDFETFESASSVSPYMEVSENLFSDNNGTDLSLSYNDWNIYIADNNFKRHRPPSGGCLLLEGSAADLKVTNNSFTANRGAYVVRIGPTNDRKFPIVFTDNDLKDNYVYLGDSGRHRRDVRSAVLVLAVSHGLVIQNNSFNNSESLFELGVGIPVQSSTELVINVSRNYWGTTDENQIADRIHDFGYCSRLASVEYFPYLISPFGRPVSSSVARTMHIVRPNGIVRGRVVNDTVLSDSGPYVITGDISVLPGRTLTIEAGVDLRFTKNTGILVEGQLIAHGTPTSPIWLTHNRMLNRKEKNRTLRLVGIRSSPYRGRVEIFFNGTWGPVCAVQNQFPHPTMSYDYDNTNVVCRELGYPGATQQHRYTDQVIRESSESAWLEQLLCRWDDDTLRQCTNYILKKSTCNYGQLVAQCSSIRSRDPSLTHWTGIRFAAGATGVSSLWHVNIRRAGITNVENSSAIQCIGANVSFFDVTVSKTPGTAVKIMHSPFVNISHSKTRLNDDNGVQLTNVASSSITGIKSRGNSNHGLEVTVSGTYPRDLQRIWNIPVLYENIVDICTHSGPLSASKPFFLRYMFTQSTTLSSPISEDCSTSIQASSQHIVSLHIMAMKGLDGHSTVNISSMTPHVALSPLYHTSKDEFMNISVYNYVSASPVEAYFLAYIEQHPKKQTSATRHYIADAILSRNTVSGLSVNTIYDVHLIRSIVFDNDVFGVHMIKNHSSYGSSVNTFHLHDNFIFHNGVLQENVAGGLVMELHNSNAIIQNNTLKENVGGGVLIQTNWDKEPSFINLLHNRISENDHGHAVSLSNPFILWSREESAVRALVFNNSIRSNCAKLYCPGSECDALLINNVTTNVTGNTFFDNTCRYVISWNGHSKTDQYCSKNILYHNAGRLRQSILVEGVAAKYDRNVFFNPTNDFEFTAGKDIGQGNYDVRNNWWGPRISSADEAESRILDKQDDDWRVRVDIQPIDTIDPWLNSSVCPPYWKAIDSNCFLYIRKWRSWAGAKHYCEMLDGRLASSLGNAIYFKLIESWWNTRGIWIDFKPIAVENTCFIRRRFNVERRFCGQTYPFVCDIAPTDPVLLPTVQSPTTTRTAPIGRPANATQWHTSTIGTHTGKLTTVMPTGVIVTGSSTQAMTAGTTETVTPRAFTSTVAVGTTRRSASKSVSSSTAALNTIIQEIPITTQTIQGGISKTATGVVPGAVAVGKTVRTSMGSTHPAITAPVRSSHSSTNGVSTGEAATGSFMHATTSEMSTAKATMIPSTFAGSASLGASTGTGEPYATTQEVPTRSPVAEQQGALTSNRKQTTGMYTGTEIIGSTVHMAVGRMPSATTTRGHSFQFSTESVSTGTVATGSSTSTMTSEMSTTAVTVTFGTFEGRVFAGEPTSTAVPSTTTREVSTRASTGITRQGVRTPDRKTTTGVLTGPAVGRMRSTTATPDRVPHYSTATVSTEAVATGSSTYSMTTGVFTAAVKITSSTFQSRPFLSTISRTALMGAFTGTAAPERITPTTTLGRADSTETASTAAFLSTTTPEMASRTATKEISGTSTYAAAETVAPSAGTATTSKGISPDVTIVASGGPIVGAVVSSSGMEDGVIAGMAVATVLAVVSIALSVVAFVRYRMKSNFNLPSTP